MIKFRKLLAVAAAAVSLLGAGVAHADYTLINNDYPGPTGFTPFGGFDWSSAAAAWTVGFTGNTGDSFKLYYAGWATAIQDEGGSTVGTLFMDKKADGVKQIFDPTPGSADRLTIGLLIGQPANSAAVTAVINNANAQAYEYTTFIELDVLTGNCPGAFCDVTVTGGTFNIFYDTNANAKSSNGTGFTDGVNIISGTFDPADFTIDLTKLTGSVGLTGKVLATDLAYVTPALANTTIPTTLQFGPDITAGPVAGQSGYTAFTAPTGFDYDGNGSSDALDQGTGPAGVIMLQADANQSFVPEPGTLALLSLALIAGGLGSKRTRRTA